MNSFFTNRIFAALLTIISVNFFISIPAIRAQFGPPAIPDKAIDASIRNAALQDTIKLVKENYVFEDTGNKIALDIDRRMKNGEYDKITSAKEFADVLTRNLRDVGHDKHLYVRLMNGASVEPFTPERARAGNFGISKAEILPNNVGYLKINEFPPPELVQETLAAAMKFLKNTDALIIDLRDHRGGAVATVAMTVSYFLPEKRLQLLTSSSPRTGFKDESWTLEKVDGPRYLDKPVYLLTSSRTFSGGEEFSYDMQALKRATLIGETTGGGANPVRLFPVQNIFSLGISFAQVKNTITGTNWEGIGVKPDIETPVEQALQKAQELASQQLQEKKGKPQMASTQPATAITSTLPASDDSALKFPDTIAGKNMKAFLNAVNSGKLDAMKKFHSEVETPEEVAENSNKDYELYQRTGGLELSKIANSSEYSITVIAKMKNSDRWVNFTMELELAPPHRIAGIRIQPAAKPAN